MKNKVTISIAVIGGIIGVIAYAILFSIVMGLEVSSFTKIQSETKGGTMKIIALHEEERIQEFAKKAGTFFSKNDQTDSYLEEILDNGGLLALRGGADSNDVIIVKLYKPFEPRQYIGLAKKH